MHNSNNQLTLLMMNNFLLHTNYILMHQMKNNILWNNLHMWMNLMNHCMFLPNKYCKMLLHFENNNQLNKLLNNYLLIIQLKFHNILQIFYFKSNLPPPQPEQDDEPEFEYVPAEHCPLQILDVNPDVDP